MDKQTLEKLYIREKLSMLKIALKFKITTGTVRYWLIKYEIPIRKWGKEKEFDISSDELVDLYLIKKMSAIKIARKKGCSPSLVYALLKNFSISRRLSRF
jgi:transposase-like protein